MKITSSTPLYAVLGHPVRQSMSPILQNGWIEACGFDGVYVALDIDPTYFEGAILGLHQSGLQGANITTPFKERAAQIAVGTSPLVQSIGAANCLTSTKQGFFADSTDGGGFIADLDARASGWRDMSGHIVLIGAGGAARAILRGLVDIGRHPVIVVNRDEHRALEAVARLSTANVTSAGWKDLANRLVGAGLVINATSMGFNGVNQLQVDLRQTLRECLVYDSVYAPQDTAFLTNAREINRQTFGGLGMLVGQGALAFERWFGVQPDFMAGLARLQAALVR